MEATVFNMLGQEVFARGNMQMKSGKHQTEINLTEFAKGIYMLQLKTDTENIIKKSYCINAGDQIKTRPLCLSIRV